MGPHDDLTIGEIGRAVSRIEANLSAHQEDVRKRYHDLANQVNVALGPISVHAEILKNQQQNLDRHEDDLTQLRAKVEAVTASANKIAGAGALMAFLSSLINWPWKH
jgi:uncharacterized protein YpuA (DUF1002 family)